MAKLNSIDLSKPIIFYGNRLCESDVPAFVELAERVGNDRLRLVSTPVTDPLMTYPDLSAALMGFVRRGPWLLVFEGNLQSLSCTALGEPLLTGWMTVEQFRCFMLAAEAAEPALQTFAAYCLRQLPDWELAGVDEVYFDGFELAYEEITA